MCTVTSAVLGHVLCCAVVQELRLNRLEPEKLLSPTDVSLNTVRNVAQGAAAAGLVALAYFAGGGPKRLGNRSGTGRKWEGHGPVWVCRGRCTLQPASLAEIKIAPYSLVSVISFAFNAFQIVFEWPFEWPRPGSYHSHLNSEDMFLWPIHVSCVPVTLCAVISDAKGCVLCCLLLCCRLQ